MFWGVLRSVGWCVSVANGGVGACSGDKWYRGLGRGGVEKMSEGSKSEKRHCDELNF